MGNISLYTSVIIGDQEWMRENLKVTRYRNGDTIPNITGNEQWGSLSKGAISSYENDPDLVETFGYLYNWYAVDDSRNIAL